MNSNPIPRGRRTRVGAIALVAVSLPAYASVALAGTAPGDPGRADGPSPSVTPTAQAALAGSPGSLAASSYLGGREWDEATGVATDARGNSYITGFTLSTDFPRVGSGTRGHAAIVDAFVTKVSADGGRILWSTQLGGVDLDLSNAVTVDGTGAVYVVGRTGSPNFPTTTGSMQRTLKGRSCTGEPCHDAFVVKLSSTGRIEWSTLFGGSRNEEAVSVAVGSDSAVYVTGLTDSANLPVRRPMQRRFQSLPCAGDVPCPYDAFVAKIAPRGDRILYSTYLGGSGTDVARGIDVDDRGHAYVTGSTGSPDFPTVRAFQRSTRGKACGPPPGEPCRQAFLTKLRPGGAGAVYSTYLGGREHDDAYGVAVDGSGSAHVTGSTQSADFPVRRAHQPRSDNRGCTSEQPEELCDDGFVTAFTSDGRSVRYSTYLGGRAQDQGLGIAVDARGRALVAGRTDSDDFPTTRGAAQRAFGGSIDGFVSRWRRGGTPLWSTFLGGTDADRVTGIAAGRGSSAHVAGRTLSKDFPTVRPFQRALKDEDYDAFTAILR